MITENSILQVEKDPVVDKNPGKKLSLYLMQLLFTLETLFCLLIKSHLFFTSSVNSKYVQCFLVICMARPLKHGLQKVYLLHRN